MAKFQPIQDISEIALEGQSRLHPIQASSRDVYGHFEVTIGEDGQLDLSAPISGHVEVLVEDLKSMNPLYDREVRKRLNIRRFPKIQADIIEIRERLEQNRYLVVGDIAFNGVTQRAEGELAVRQISQERLEVQGELTIDVRDFKVEPPNLFMVGIMPTVQVNLRLMMRPVD